ncbi:hypothetical protein Prudu_012927 [Prunus dulcis]|uniref:Integrase catalytic domain-containing protein n=1 Tax=Prunus dulcis TaxID=3755 RepID=A0A4Y1REE5_PRUDU|nr:hypothetical protein Prudu_012927 [Prunus dulcis]
MSDIMVLVSAPVLCLSYLLVFFFSTAIMGDDSKIVVSASASTTKEERPSRDYSTPITSDKLDGSNYASWSRGARITITSRRMASWINGKKPAPSLDSAAYAEWEEDNCLVQSWLLNSMTKPVRALFEHGATAYDIWEAARKTYTMTQNSSRLFQLRRQSIVTCQNGESVKVFYEKLHAIWQEIDCLRPHEYSCADDGARRLKELEADRVYDFLGGLDPPYDGVHSRILALSPVPPPLKAYAMVMEEDTRQSAILGGGSMALKVDPHVKGWHFSELGPSRELGVEPVGRDPAEGENFLDEERPIGMGSNTWIIDTDASDHMTYDDNMFDELSHIPRDPILLVLMVYLPQLPVKDLKTHEKIGHGKRIGGCITYSYRLQHSCDESSFKCETCVMAKSHRTVFPLSNNKAALPFELVHSDVWGPARVTSHGFRWFVTFIDDCTRLTWVYLMKHKHDVASILPVFCAMVSTQFHASVKVFRTDNGGEYVNHTLTQFFRDQGIIHQTTTPFTPQQNGVSERKNRQLLEVARSLMLDMSVPTIFGDMWVLDFKTPLDVLCAHTPPVSVSKLPPKVFGWLLMFMSTPINGVNLTHVLSAVSSLAILPLRRVTSATTLLHRRSTVLCLFLLSNSGGEGSELKNFRMENLEYTEASQAICAKPTDCPEGDDWSPSTMRDDCVKTTICAKPIGRQEGDDRSPSAVETTIYAKPTGWPEGHDRSPVKFLDEICPLPVECNSDIGDSCEDEIDIRPLSALPLSQSTRDEDALSNPKWVDVMHVEMEALNKNATWELVPLPKGKKAVGCRWVFTLKHKADGSIDRYKARLIAKGYTQTYRVDYTETFAPVAKLNTVRVLLSLAANHDWPLLQFDVKNAFLHGDLKEEIYMDPPPGIPVTSKEGMVCKLRKSLYGLKQSPRAWFGRFTASMRKSGYIQSNSDHTLFMKHRKGKLTALIIYVDDMIVTGDDQAEIQSLQKYLASEFEMKSLSDLKYFLGIEVARSKHGIFLSQRKYVLDLLAETGMLDCKPIDTPSEQNHKLGLYPDQVPTDKERYQQLVGKLIYLAHTRPDIAYAVSVVSQFMHSPSEDHMGAVTRILRYLKVTLARDVEGYTDADWAGSATDRRSTSGYFTFVGGNLVTWRSKKQKVVSRSSAEAEYRGMAMVYAAIAIAHNPVQHGRPKHVEVDPNFIKETLDAEIVSFPFISSEYQLAYVLTKAVSTSIFHNSLDKLGTSLLQLVGECWRDILILCN